MKALLLRRGSPALLIALAALWLAACTSGGLVNKNQFHTPLQCPPCPTLAPVASYPLPSEVPFGSNAYLGGMASGPDGNLWVAEFDANKIARVTTAGVVTEFDVPTANAGPYLM